MSDHREGVPLLPPAADGGAAPRDSLAAFTIRFVAVADVVEPARPLGVRARLLLKFALRQCGFRSKGFADTGGIGADEPAQPARADPDRAPPDRQRLPSAAGTGPPAAQGSAGDARRPPTSPGPSAGVEGE